MTEYSNSDWEHDVTWPPQISAVLENDLEHLKTILEAGESPNAIDKQGRTPLHYAVITKNDEIFNYLLTVKDVDINVRDFNEATPLILAVQDSLEGYVRKLINNGADVSIPFKNGDTPLHVAIGKSLPLALMLIERKADVNIQNRNGETPLFTACQKKEWDFSCMLLYYEADVNICDTNGVAPLVLCLKDAHTSPEQLEVLFNYSFDELKTEVELMTLVEIMKTESPIFYQVIEKTSHILYTEEDLIYLTQTMTHVPGAMFRVLLDKFPNFGDDFFDVADMPMHSQYLFYGAKEFTDFIQFFYALCESRFILSIMENYVSDDLLQLLFDAQLPEETAFEFVCCLLSYGLSIYSRDLYLAYECYGFGKLFKILLHMDITYYDSWLKPLRAGVFFFPRIIYDVNLCFEDFLKIPEESRSGFILQYVRKLFTIERNTSVPSLQELSREMARKHIIQTYKIKNNVQYFTILRHLLGNSCMSILTYEKEIY